MTFITHLTFELFKNTVYIWQFPFEFPFQKYFYSPGILHAWFIYTRVHEFSGSHLLVKAKWKILNFKTPLPVSKVASAIKSYRRISFSYHNRLTEFVVCDTQIQSTQTTVIGNPSAVVKIDHSFSSSFLKESYICFDSKVTAKPVSTSILISTFLLKHKSARFKNLKQFVLTLIPNYATQLFV